MLYEKSMTKGERNVKRIGCLFLAMLLCVSMCACGKGNKYTVKSKNGEVAQMTVKEIEKLKDDAIAFENTISGSVISGSGEITKIENSATFAGQWSDHEYYTVYINDELSVRIRAVFAADLKVGQHVQFEGRYYSFKTMLELLPVNDNYDTPSPSVY